MGSKILLVYAPPDARSINILVPKRRGEGYLVVPFGHHVSGLSAVEAEVGFDIYGLDGSLDIQTGYYGRTPSPELLEGIMKPLCRHYDMDYRMVDGVEYWEKHPIHPKHV